MIHMLRPHDTGLTKNVYRWTPTRQGWTQNAHTVDEAINMDAHMEAVKFYYDLVRNFDASDA
jgi:Gly-Xaa carboxypeptidase